MPRGLILILLSVFGSGCSSTQFAYRNADWFIEHYARQAVDVNDEQRERWQPMVQSKLQQHREELLPLVISYLDGLDAALQPARESPDIDCLVNGAITLYRMHAELAVELSAPLLSELDTGQIEHLQDYLTETNAELRERYRAPDPAQRQAARIERITERVERWTGRLTADQRRQLGEDILRIPDLTGRWLDYRKGQTDTLLRMLQGSPDEATLQGQLRRWWVQREDLPAAADRDWETARQGFITLLQNLGMSLTDRQRATFERRIADLRSDLAAFQTATQETRQQQATFACGPSTV